MKTPYDVREVNLIYDDFEKGIDGLTWEAARRIILDGTADLCRRVAAAWMVQGWLDSTINKYDDSIQTIEQAKEIRAWLHSAVRFAHYEHEATYQLQAAFNAYNDTFLMVVSAINEAFNIAHDGFTDLEGAVEEAFGYAAKLVENWDDIHPEEEEEWFSWPDEDEDEYLRRLNQEVLRRALS
jgi:hypothetical protein